MIPPGVTEATQVVAIQHSSLGFPRATLAGTTESSDGSTMEQGGCARTWQSHEAHKLHVWRLECSPSSSGPDAARAIQPLLFRGTVPDVVVRGVMEDIKINKLELKLYK